MARLAPSLVNLFDEINILWPHRDHRTDGWIGDAAHQATQSDHNPDSRGIVHAIDIDKDGIDPTMVVSAIIDDALPTSYVVWNRQIWSRSRRWVPRAYTGSNPHTDHIHVSIQYGPHWESADWHWGLVNLGTSLDVIWTPTGDDDMDDWHTLFERAATEYTGAAYSLAQSNAAITGLLS